MRSADAATRTWNVTSGTGVWQTSGNWLSAAPADSTTTDTARFSTSNGNQTAQLNANTSIAGLTFAQTGSTTLTSDSAAARTLTIGTTGITINAGAGAGTLGDAGSPLNVAISGGQSWTNNAAPANRFTVLGGITSSAASGTQTLTVTGTGATLFSGNLANGSSGGTLALVKSGNGTLTLSGNNTYTGTTTSSAGMLALTQRQSLYGANTANWTSSLLRITGGTLALNMGGTGEFTDSDVQTLTTGSMFSGGNGTWLALDTSNATGPVTFSANMNNTNAGSNISFAKLGAGTLIVAGTIGTTSSSRTVASGTLQIGTATTAGSFGGVNTLNNGTIVFEAQQTGMNTITGTGQVIKKGNTQMNVSVDQTYTGLTTIESGTLRCQDGGATAGWLAGDVLNNGVLSLNRNAAKEFVGAISGTGSLVIAGVNASSNVILTNSNSFTGGTTINSGGRLTIGNGGTNGSIVGNVANSGTLGFNRSDAISFSGTISGGGGLLKQAGNTLTLSAANTYTGTTNISQGTIRVGVANALPSTSAVSLTADGSLDVANSTSSGALTLGGTGTIFGGGTLTASSYTLSNTTGTATASATLAGAAASLTKSGDGTAVLSAANTFAGKTTIAAGILEVSSIRSVNGGASSLGAPTTAANGTIDLGSGTSTGTLRYVGAGHSSDRTINIVSSVGGTVDASGSGGLDMTSGTISAAANAVVTLTGSSTFDSSIGPINGTGVSVTKTGPGTWRILGDGNYSGRLAVLDGTVVAAPVGSSNSPFGSSTGSSSLPLIGDSSPNASGTVALLALSGSVSRGFWVAPSGTNGSQIVVLGGVGSGTTYFASGHSIYLGRNVTLQASNGGTVEFASSLRDYSTGELNPVVAFTIGSTGNAGTVVLGRQLPTSSTAVNVVAGTLQPNADERIVSSTPVSLGAAGGPATLDLFGFTQSLASLAFSGSGSSVTSSQAGGTLRLYNNGTSNAAVNVSGTGHQISTAMALDDPASLNVNTGGRLLVSSAISGSSGKSLTKTGLGILELTGTSSYPGATLVSAGSLFVNGRLTTSAVSVQSGGLLGGSGTFDGGISVLAGGTLSPGNSPGLVTTSSLDLAGTLLMEIDGTAPRGGIGGYDAIDVSGLLTYGGSMVIDFGSLINNALPNGTEFDLFAFSSGSSSGSFSAITTANDGSWYAGLTFANSGGTWTAQKDSQRLEFTQSTGNLVIVPEPASLALAAIGIAAAATTAFRARHRCRRGRTGPRSSWQPV